MQADVLAEESAKQTGPDAKQSKPTKQDASTATAPATAPVTAANPKDDKNVSEQNEDKGGDGLWGSLTTTVDGATFWVLVIQSGFLVWTIVEMTKSDERQLRAWVSFKTFDPKLSGGENVTFSLGFLNHGQTPALKVGFRAFMKIVKRKELAPDLPPPKSQWPMERDMATVFPYVEKEGWGNDGMDVTLGDKFTQPEIDGVINANPGDPEAPVFYVIIEIEYFDSLAKAWRTTKETYYSRTHKDKNVFEFGVLPGGSTAT